MFITKNSKFSLKIPNFISTIFFKKNKIIIFKSKTEIRFLKIHFKLMVILFKNKLFLFNNFVLTLSNNFKNNLCYYKKKILSLLSHFLIELQAKIYSKLNLVGIGYKILLTDYSNILIFKLGYSHSIYLKLNLSFFTVRFTKLFMVSSFYGNLMQFVSLIKKFRLPEPYKGKGIILQNEQLKLKTIKKS